jgi:hypothetical protein
VFLYDNASAGGCSQRCANYCANYAKSNLYDSGFRSALFDAIGQ